MLPQTGITYHSCTKNWSTFHCVHCYGKFYNFRFQNTQPKYGLWNLRNEDPDSYYCLHKRITQFLHPISSALYQINKRGRFRTWFDVNIYKDLDPAESMSKSRSITDPFQTKTSKFVFFLFFPKKGPLWI